MKGSRRVVLAAALAVVVLVSPAIGAGKSTSRSLAWSRGGIAVTAYDFATHAPGYHMSKDFSLANVGRHPSGKFAIHLTGSSAFSISSARCTGKSLDVGKRCRVTIAYAPSQPGAHDRAVLTATRAHRTAARLAVSGCGAEISHVYWIDQGYDEDAGTVNKGLFADGCTSTITTLASGWEFARSVAVDGTHVYWVDGVFEGTVNEVPLDGGNVTTLATGQNDPVSLAVDGTHVYWANYWDPSYDYTQGSVNEAPLGGGPVTILASPESRPTSVATDGTNVYWSNDDGGTVNEIPIGGGPVTTLASGQSHPISVATDGTHVYWINEYTDDYPGYGAVNEVPVGGGEVTTLASDQSYPVSLAVDATHVYWVNGGDGTVNAVPVGGGSVTTLASGQAYPDSVAVDGTHVYWVNYAGTVMDVPLGGGKPNTIARYQEGPVAVAVGH